MRLIDVKTAAEILGIKTFTVYDMVRRGVIPPGVVVRLGRKVMFNPDKLRAWLESGGSAKEEPK